MLRKTLLLAFFVLLPAGCGEEEAVHEPGAVEAARLEPAERREIEAAADGFFHELFMLHEPEARAFVDFAEVGRDEWERYWGRLKSYELEVASVKMLGVEPTADSDRPAARIGLNALLVVKGEEISVEDYRLRLVKGPDGWRLAELPFAE